MQVYFLHLSLIETSGLQVLIVLAITGLSVHLRANIKFVTSTYPFRR